MAKYRITDNQSGKTLVISGDTPPTEQEAEQLFQQSGIREQRMTPQQALAKQVPLVPEQKINPIIQAAGKAQEFLGNSPLLPMLTSGAARAALPIPGISSGVGAMVGERAKQSLQEGGPVAALKMAIPSLEQNPDVRNEIVKSGLGAAATDIALTGAGKVVKSALDAKSVNPFKIVGNIRAKEVAAVNPLTEQESIELGKQIMEKAQKAPAAFREDAIKLAETYVNDFKSGKSIADIFDAKKNASAVGYIAQSGAKVRGADAWMEREAASVMNNVLKIKAPKAKAADALFSFLYSAPKTVQKASWLLAKLRVGMGGL